MAAAHESGAQVGRALPERRPDGRAVSRNAPLFRAAERLPVLQLAGTAAVRAAPPIEIAEDDIVVRRLHGLSPIQGTEADALPRNLGCRRLIGSPASRPMWRSPTRCSTP